MDYIVRAHEEELGDSLYCVSVPEDVKPETVLAALKMATKYATTEEIWYDEETNSDKTIEKGIAEFDEHYAEMLKVAEDHRLERFEHYVSKCMKWKITEHSVKIDFSFEW